MLKRFFGNSLEEFGIFGVAERIAALNEVETQLVQSSSDQDFVFQRKVDAFPLGTVAQRGVVDLDVHGGKNGEVGTGE